MMITNNCIMIIANDYMMMIDRTYITVVGSYTGETKAT